MQNFYKKSHGRFSLSSSQLVLPTNQQNISLNQQGLQPNQQILSNKKKYGFEIMGYNSPNIDLKIHTKISNTLLYSQYFTNDTKDIIHYTPLSHAIHLFIILITYFFCFTPITFLHMYTIDNMFSLITYLNQWFSLQITNHIKLITFDKRILYYIFASIPLQLLYFINLPTYWVLLVITVMPVIMNHITDVYKFTKMYRKCLNYLEEFGYYIIAKQTAKVLNVISKECFSTIPERVNTSSSHPIYSIQNNHFKQNNSENNNKNNNVQNKNNNVELILENDKELFDPLFTHKDFNKLVRNFNQNMIINFLGSFLIASLLHYFETGGVNIYTMLFRQYYFSEYISTREMTNMEDKIYFQQLLKNRDWNKLFEPFALNKLINYYINSDSQNKNVIGQYINNLLSVITHAYLQFISCWIVLGFNLFHGAGILTNLFFISGTKIQKILHCCIIGIFFLLNTISQEATLMLLGCNVMLFLIINKVTFSIVRDIYKSK